MSIADDAQAVDLSWDPTDPDLHADPHALWRRFRDEEPVHRNDGQGFYALFRYDDVRAAHADHRLFSSSHGRELRAMANDRLQSSSLVFLDPPEHTTLRRLVGGPFTARRLAAYEERIRRVCAAVLDAQVGRGRFDYGRDVAAILPRALLWDLLGVEPAAGPDLTRLVTDLLDRDGDGAGAGAVSDAGLRARIELSRFWRGELRERRRRRGDDIVTGLLDAGVAGDGSTRELTLDEVVDLTSLLVSAGSETVRLFLGWAAVLLADHPDQRAELVAEPALIPGAIEELLRFEAPSHVQGRVLTAPVVLHGVAIPAGARVLLVTGSAGRDGRRYDNPDRLDLRRPADGHLALGHGAHFCLGAALARLQLRVALEETLLRFPRWDVDRVGAVRFHTTSMRGWDRVPVMV